MSIAAAGPSLRETRPGTVLTVIRKGLDHLYDVCGYLAAACMVAILVLTIGQMACRLLAINIRGLTDYAGYCMAGAAFLAFAHTLNNGGHIRIEIFASLLGRYRVYADGWALACSAAVTGWFAYYSCSMVYWSYKLGDVSTGLDATPLWIPQVPMAIGSVLFTVALADHLLQLLLTGKHGIKPSTEIL